ncbi:hypothetical protein ACFLZZ_03290 [Nanoarchaeota archaeon]
MKKEDNLYIFLHTPKAAGSTFRTHIENNFRKKEILPLYKGKDSNLASEKGVHKYIKSLTKDQKNKIKIIYGHCVFYGIHKFFDKNPIYFTFFREPIAKTVSSYNFGVTDLKKLNNRKIKEKNKGEIERIKELKRILTKRGGITPFKEWLIKSYDISKLPTMKTQTRFLFERKFLDSPKPNKESIKKCLNKFYLVGTVKSFKEDTLFLYNLLGIKRFYNNQNISEKHFVLNEKDNALKNKILSKNKFDSLLYSQAILANNSFKKKIKGDLEKLKSTKKRTMKKAISNTLVTIDCLPKLVYGISCKLKRHSRTYKKLVDWVKPTPRIDF